MLYTNSSKLTIYNVTTKNLEYEFEFITEKNAVDKDVLLNVPNPLWNNAYNILPSHWNQDE